MASNAPNGYTPPQETYYPSCVVDLRIRYDSAFTLNATGATVFSVGSASNPSGTAIPFSTGTEAAANTGISVFLDPSTTTDNLSHIIGRIPIRANVELPAYRSAGTFHLTFDYKDLPIDPRLIRACGVSIYMDTVAAAGFAQGASGKTAVGQPPSFIGPNAKQSILTPTVKNLALVGVVDNWSVQHSSKGSTVTIEGRDQRGLLLNSPLNPALFEDLDLNQPIDAVIRDILAKHGDLGMIDVSLGNYVTAAVTGKNVYDDFPNGVPSPVTEDGATDVSELRYVQPKPTVYAARNGVRTRVRKRANGKGWRPSAKGAMGSANYWDLIVNYCSIVGTVPYFESENILRIKPGRNLFDQTSADPYSPAGAFGHGVQSRNVGEPQPLRIRRMVFGHNVEELTYERKFMGIYGRTIKLASLDTSSPNRGEQKLITVEYPTEADFKAMAAARGLPLPPATNVDKAKVTRESPSGKTAAKEEILIYTKPGINSVTRLRSIAMDLYEEMMRGEQGGSIKTRSLASFGGSNADPDLLYVRPGDSVELVVNSRSLEGRVPVVSTLNAQEQGLSDGRLFQQLKAKLGDENHARALIASLKGYAVQLQNIYRVKDVKLDWDIGTGVTISFNFQNYIVPRQELLPVGTGSGTSSSGVVASPTPGTNVVPR